MPLIQTGRQAVRDLLYFVDQQANIMNWTSDQQSQLLALIHQRSERAVLDQQLKHTEAELAKQEAIRQQAYEQLLTEEKDVDRLERLSWAKVYYDLLNQREEQLTKEQAEAEVALVRYDALRAQVADLTTRKTQLQEQLKAYETLDTAYDDLIQQKTGALLVQDGNTNRQYRAHIDALSVVDKQLHELNEAHAAGLKALNEVRHLVVLLDEARSLGNWDMFTKSSILSMQKYQKLDHVKHQSYRVSWHLKQFNAECADVHQTMDADWQFDDGLTRFADIFFDNIFTDWSVQQRIERAHHEARILEMKLVHILKTLKTEVEQAVSMNQNRAAELRNFLEKV